MRRCHDIYDDVGDDDVDSDGMLCWRDGVITWCMSSAGDNTCMHDVEGDESSTRYRYCCYQLVVS